MHAGLYKLIRNWTFSISFLIRNLVVWRPESTQFNPESKRWRSLGSTLLVIFKSSTDQKSRVQGIESAIQGTESGRQRWNPESKGWNSEFKESESGIQGTESGIQRVESIIPGVEAGIQTPLDYYT